VDNSAPHYEYPFAGGRKAPPEVQAAVERFRLLPESEKEKLPLLYWLLGEGTPPYKMSRIDSKYTVLSPVAGQNCANCIFTYLQPKRNVYICSQIAGTILPEAWCRLWRPF
jgi:hypothetical protein